MINKRSRAVASKCGVSDKRPRKKKMIFKCTNKQQTIRKFLHHEQNIHGALDDVHKEIPITELHFAYCPQIRVNEIPEIIYCTYVFCTSNQEVANKFTVGEEYKELPK